MSYKVNPCKAVGEKLRNANCDINTINGLCYEIASAYGDVYGSELKKKLDNQCREMISEKKCSLGYSDCYLKRPSPPPIWNQIPHYFPSLFKEREDVNKAYKQCCNMCSSSKYSNECKEKCKLDADAIVKTPNVENYNENYNENYTKKVVSNTADPNPNPDPDYEGYKDAHPFVFYMGFGIVVVMIMLLVIYFIRSLMAKK
jgi:hypothetical protein